MGTPLSPLFDRRRLRKLIVPMVIEQALLISVGMVDTVMIAGVGEAQVSGVSLVDMINNLIICIFTALATGGAVVVSQCIGAGDSAQARKGARQLIAITLAASVAVMTLCLALNGPILSLFFGKIEPDVRQSARTYFRITALSFPFIALYNGGAALFRAIGNSRISMLASLFSNLLNAVGNAILIYGFRLGVTGAAIATTFSRGAAMVLILFLLTRPRNPLCLRGERFVPDWPMMRRILYIGIPSSVENSVFELGRVIVVSIIAGFGTVQVAANAVANTMDNVGVIIGKSMGLAILTVVGQTVGTGDYTAVRKNLRTCMKLTYAMHTVWNILVLATLPLTIRLFRLSPDTQSLAMTLIFIHNGCAILLWPMAFAFPNALRAANDVRFTMRVSMTTMITCRILLSIVLGQMLGWGALGVWTGMVVDWIARGTCFYVRYRSGKWTQFRPKKADPAP